MPAYVTMTPVRYHEALAALRVTQRELARMLQCSYRLTADWGIGKQKVPPAVADWLNDCIKLRQQHPYPEPPNDWRRFDPRFNLRRARAREEAKAAKDNPALVDPKSGTWAFTSRSKHLRRGEFETPRQNKSGRFKDAASPATPDCPP
jgi:hypothetical protein